MGLEPTTFCVQGRRSSHLNYDPKLRLRGVSGSNRQPNDEETQIGLFCNSLYIHYIIEIIKTVAETIEEDLGTKQNDFYNFLSPNFPRKNT